MNAKDLDDLKAYYATWTTPDLQNVVDRRSHEFAPEAIALIRDELARRPPDGSSAKESGSLVTSASVANLQSIREASAPQPSGSSLQKHRTLAFLTYLGVVIIAFLVEIAIIAITDGDRQLNPFGRFVLWVGSLSLASQWLRNKRHKGSRSPATDKARIVISETVPAKQMPSSEEKSITPQVQQSGVRFASGTAEVVHDAPADISIGADQKPQRKDMVYITPEPQQMMNLNSPRCAGRFIDDRFVLSSEELRTILTEHSSYGNVFRLSWTNNVVPGWQTWFLVLSHTQGLFISASGTDIWPITPEGIRVVRRWPAYMVIDLRTSDGRWERVPQIPVATGACIIAWTSNSFQEYVQRFGEEAHLALVAYELATGHSPSSFVRWALPYSDLRKEIEMVAHDPVVLRMLIGYIGCSKEARSRMIGLGLTEEHPLIVEMEAAPKRFGNMLILTFGIIFLLMGLLCTAFMYVDVVFMWFGYGLLAIGVSLLLWRFVRYMCSHSDS